MRRVLFAVLALALAGPAFGADCTWSLISGASRSVLGVGAVNCTLTVATASATAGMNLAGVAGFSVRVCATTAAATITTAFSLLAYLQDPYTLKWAPAPEYNLSSTSTGDECASLGGWSVPSPAGRIAYAPSAGAVSAGGISIRLTATSLAGDRL